MSEAALLMQAVLGPGVTSDEAAAMLHDALCSEVDPLHFCAIHLGLTPAQVMRRAAEWADLAYFDSVPRRAPGDVTPPRLDFLGEVRMFRLPLLDREAAYAAPDFFGILRLKRACQANPALRGRLCLVPEPALRGLLVDVAEAALIDGARQTLAKTWPHAVAQLDLSRPVRWGFAITMTVLVTLVLIGPLTGQPWVMPLWLLIVILPTLLRIAALLMPVPERGDLPSASAGEELPLYSILVPLRDEANMVDQLCTSLSRLDYPPDKLEIIFVVESRSPETVAAVHRHLDDARFQLIVVPDAMPRTKPKALDFALPLCHGEFVVVYDAEDRPEPAQLRRIVAQFRDQPGVECIQARLVIDNGEHGALPALFAGEYAGLFTVMLPAFARWNAVMPLGGTSNHFRLSTLRKLGGWDAYNVTEDADLGVRLARRRLATATSTTYTLEEAPTRIMPWLGQRRRWMKGWMQTFMVHNRRPLMLLADLGWRGFVLFEITILGMLLAPFLHVGFALVLAWMLHTGMLTQSWLDPWLILCIVALVLGHGAAILVNLVGLARTGQRHYWPAQALLPLYWLLISWATARALGEFVHAPFHWFKTPHRAKVVPPNRRPVSPVAQVRPKPAE